MRKTGIGMVGYGKGKQPNGDEWLLHSSAGHAGQVRQQPAEHGCISTQCGDSAKLYQASAFT